MLSCWKSYGAPLLHDIQHLNISAWKTGTTRSQVENDSCSLYLEMTMVFFFISQVWLESNLKPRPCSHNAGAALDLSWSLFVARFLSVGLWRHRLTSDSQVNGHLRSKRASEVLFLEDEKPTAYYNILRLGMSLQKCSFSVRWGRGLTKVSVGAGARKPPEIFARGSGRWDGGVRWTVVLIMAP